jgi:hypothetical protein
LAFFDFLLARPICSRTRFGEASHLRDEGVVVTSHFLAFTHFFRGERFANVRLMCQEKKARDYRVFYFLLLLVGFFLRPSKDLTSTPVAAQS